VQALLPDADPAYLVTDYSYLLFSTEHNDDASLAGDVLKGSLLAGKWDGVLTRSGVVRCVTARFSGYQIIRERSILLQRKRHDHTQQHF
jgi:hypothetical protein